MRMFAADTLIYMEGETVGIVQEKLSEELTRVGEWLRMNKESKNRRRSAVVIWEQCR